MEANLITEKNEVLYAHAAEWDFTADGSPLELIKEMTRIMFEHRGIGLAAPQIGVSKRIFIMGNKELLIACINPSYFSAAPKTLDLEGCLSFPNLWLRIYRHENVMTKYQDVEGKAIETDFEGIQARVFQHEYDHLDGICFDTKVSRLSLDLAKKKQRKATNK
jgi:peptide deformylase